jgi:hypothetical protein
MNSELFIPFVSVVVIMIFVPLLCLNEVAKHHTVTHCRFELYKMRDVLFDRLICPNIGEEEKSRVLSVIQIIHSYLFLVDRWSMLRFRSIIFNPPTPEQVRQNELFINGMDDSLVTIQHKKNERG